MRPRLPRPLLPAVAGLLLIGALARSAHAQNEPDRGTFSPQLFHPATGPDEFFGVQAAQPLPHLNFSGGLWVNYSRTTFTILTVDQNKVGKPRAHILENALAADLVLALGLGNRLQVGLGIPVTIFQNGQDFNYVDDGVPGTLKAGNGFAMGDPWLDVKLRLYGKDRGINIALDPFVSFPVGGAVTPNNYGGDKSFTFGGNLLGGFESDRWRAGISLGFLGRLEPSYVFSTTIGHQILYAAALAIDPLEKRRLSIVGEIQGRTDVSATCPKKNPMCSTGITNLDANPLELRLGAKARLTRSVFGTVGAGVGLVKGVGSPEVRVFLGITFAPDRRDRDGDGIPDQDDKCPDTPEDKDGYQDDDGCPEADNDGDNIPDVKDKCPNQAEDFDQFQDEDGCPEPDNDQDGVIDLKDACPMDKEDGKPPKPADGCPIDKTDSDEDGIPDNKDKCPLEPEDKDKFEDEDGCPDVDNDNDGIPDQYDKCPNNPEDMDGFEDDDGCPEPDNDKDGVLDKDDKCPKEPETINGYKDEDGCPDNGPPPKVQIVGDEIVILEKVFFDTNKATIQAKSFNLLQQVAATVRAHPELLKIKIEGHTDSRGSVDRNRKLSQDRAEAVRLFLVTRGVDGGRLESQGFGPDRPVSDNKTAKGREANRRVEFHITERAKASGSAE